MSNLLCGLGTRTASILAFRTRSRYGGPSGRANVLCAMRRFLMRHARCSLVFQPLCKIPIRSRGGRGETIYARCAMRRFPSGADEDKITTKHLFERVSIALWRGNRTPQCSSTGLPLSHLHWMDTLGYLLFHFYSFVLYSLVCTSLALN